MSKLLNVKQGGDAVFGAVTADTISGHFETQELTASGAITITMGTVLLNHASTPVAATLAAPSPGSDLLIVDNSASGTAAHTVTLPTGVTFDGTNSIATLNAPNEALHIRAISATRWFILENIGSVALSAP